MKKEETAEKEKKTTDGFILNADKHSPVSSARSTKRRVRGDASVSGPLTDREATAFMSK